MSWADQIRRISDALQMMSKWALSYRKREWDLEDYPIRVRVQKDVPTDSRYWARILGWNIDGLGRTREDALGELRKWYDTRKAESQKEGEPVPRPGVRVPIKFASQTRLRANEELLNDFVHRILEFEWAFISDESSLCQFHSDESNEKYLTRIKDVYGVDVSDVAGGKGCGDSGTHRDGARSIERLIRGDGDVRRVGPMERMMCGWICWRRCRRHSCRFLQQVQLPAFYFRSAGVRDFFGSRSAGSEGRRHPASAPIS